VAARSPSLLAALVALIVSCGPQTTTRNPQAGASDAGAEPGLDPASGREHVLPYGARTVYAYADKTLDHEVARLFSLLEDLRSEGATVGPDTRLPIGWTTLSFAVEGQNGERLVVEEPDYANHPETQTRQDISVSLATLARQRGVLERAKVAGEAINFDQHVLTIRGVLEIEEVLLLRVESPGGRLTGWRLTPTAGIVEADELESLPVYAILEARPALLDAMLLPAGFMASYVGDQLMAIVNERDEVVWDGSSSGAELEHRPGRSKAEPLLEPIP
jgi:hypothetical protein